MGGNKKKSINITTKNTNKKAVEISKEPLVPNNSYDLLSTSNHVNNDDNETYVDINMDNTTELNVKDNTLDVDNSNDGVDTDNIDNDVDDVVNIDNHVYYTNNDANNIDNDVDNTDNDGIDTNNIDNDVDNVDNTDNDGVDIDNIDNNLDDANNTNDNVDDANNTNDDANNTNNNADNIDNADNSNDDVDDDDNTDNDDLLNNIDALNNMNIIDLEPLDTLETEDELETTYYESCIDNIDNGNKYVETNYAHIHPSVIDYTKSSTAGIQAIVYAGESITQYQGVEVFIKNDQTFVRPFSPLSNSPFFGVAQHDASIGEEITIITSGITKIQVFKNINLPYLIRSGNQCVFAKNQKNGTVMTQITSVPINTNDILVGYGTSSDTLSGPNSVIYSVNKSNNTAGRFIVHKKILINQSQCKFVIDSIDSNNIQTRKGINTHGRTITVLDPMPESTDLCIVMI
jgi:hypothetical protein